MNWWLFLGLHLSFVLIIEFNVRAYPLTFSTAISLLVLFINFSVKPGNIYTRWYVASVSLFLEAM